MGEPAGILLLIDKNVFGLRRAEAMPPHLHGPMIVVELDVEEALAVLAPDNRAVGFLDETVEILAGLPVAHTHAKIFRARGVRAPGVQPVVRRVATATE